MSLLSIAWLILVAVATTGSSRHLRSASTVEDLAPSACSAFDIAEHARQVFVAFNGSIACSSCDADTPLTEWASVDGQRKLLETVDDAAASGSLSMASLEALNAYRSGQWCVLSVPLNVPFVRFNLSSLQVEGSGLGMSGLYLVVVPPTQSMVPMSVVVDGAFDASFVRGLSVQGVPGLQTSEVTGTPQSVWELMAHLPLDILDLSGTMQQRPEFTVPEIASLTNVFTSAPRFIKALLLDHNNLTRVAASNLFGNASMNGSSSSSSIEMLSLRLCGLIGDPLILLSGNVLPRLRVLHGDGNPWATVSNIVDVGTIADALTLVTLSECGLNGTLVLDGSCTAAAIQTPPLRNLSLDLSGNAFSNLVISAARVDQTGMVDALLAVIGVAALNVSHNNANNPLAVDMIDGQGVNVAGRWFVDALRTAAIVDLSFTPLRLNDRGALMVSASAPSWVCGPSMLCRNVALRSCNISVDVLNLSHVGENWLSLDLQGSNYFDSVVQPSGLESTEPVLLSALACSHVVPCYVGSYTRCACEGPSSSSSSSGAAPPEEPFWHKRSVWATASVVVAVLSVSIVVALCVKRRYSRHSNGHFLVNDASALEELDERPKQQWSREDEALILCDAQECSFLFDQYLVMGRLGDGTTAEVFKVKRKSDQRTLAMKRYTLRSDAAVSDDGSISGNGEMQFEWIELFKEFWLLRHVEHPNIIRVEEVFISFFDPLLPDANLSNSFGATRSTLMSSGSLQTSRGALQWEHYPPESLKDRVTPFLDNFERNNDAVTKRAVEQQNKSRRYCYIVMSYVPDGTLGGYLHRRRDDAVRARHPNESPLLCEEEALSLGLQLFRALAYLHEPHRRQHLWSIASGGAAPFADSSTCWFHKPDALCNFTNSSRPFYSSTAFRSSSAVPQEHQHQHPSSRVLVEDGPILHRDVKPDNLLIEIQPGHQIGVHSQLKYPNARLILTDFGFADVYRQGVQVAQKGAPPVYAAPEVSRRCPLPASDVFSAGVVLFEMLSARKTPTRTGNFATNLTRTTFVESQIALLSSLGVRSSTSRFLFECVLVVDPLRRCTAMEAADGLRALLHSN